MREVLFTEVLVEIKQGIGISRAEDEIKQLMFNAYKHDGLEVNVQINTSSHISQLITPSRPSNLFDVAKIQGQDTRGRFCCFLSFGDSEKRVIWDSKNKR